MRKLILKLPILLSWSLVELFLIMPVWLFLSVWLGDLTGKYEIWRSLPSFLVAIISFSSFGFVAIRQREVLYKFLKDKINILVILFGLMIIASVWLGDASWKAKMAGVAMDGRFFLAFLSVRLLTLIEPSFWQSMLRFVPKFLVVSGSILAILGFIQVTFLPKDFLTIFGYSFDGVAPYVSIDQGDTLRAFATMAGPNNYANYLLMALLSAVFLAYRSIGKSRFIYVLSALAITFGLVVSSSRAAWLAVVFALVCYFILNFKISRRAVFSFAAGLVFLVGIGFILLETPTFRENILHIRDDRNTTTTTSNDAHVEALLDGVDRVVDEPLGCGVGCAGPASYYSVKGAISENYYLQVAEQYGIFGAVLFVAIFSLILVRLRQNKRGSFAVVWLSAGIGLGFAALFAHTFTDESVAMTWFIVAGALIGGSKAFDA